MYTDDEVYELIRALQRYDRAADKFIQKVQDGRARSTETYNDLIDARAFSAVAQKLKESVR